MDESCSIQAPSSSCIKKNETTEVVSQKSNFEGSPHSAYFTEPSKIEISHYGQTKHPAMYTTNPITFDWDGSCLRVYVDNTIVASWVWGEQRWE